MQYMCGHSIALLSKLRGDRCLTHIGREGLADLVAYPSDLFVDSAHLYWVEAETIWRSGKTPVVPTELAMGEHPTRVSADDGHLYWIDGVRGWGDLRQRPKSGGASTLIAPNVVAFVIDERTIYWVVHQGFVTQRAK